MLTPYEVIVKTALPAVRGLLAEKLTKKYGLKQKEIASLLHVTQAAVSYYLTKSRGKYVDHLRDTEINNMVDKLSETIIKEKPNPEELAKHINKIIIEVIRKGYLCDYHMLLEDIGEKEECKLCETILEYWDTEHR